jgi:hypothetical protein
MNNDDEEIGDFQLFFIETGSELFTDCGKGCDIRSFFDRFGTSSIPSSYIRNIR